MIDRRFVGIPFADGAPSFKGANCYTILQLVYKHELGIELPSYTIPAKYSNRVFINFLNTVALNWDKVDEPEYLDVVAMAHDMARPNLIQHFGLYIGEGRILHTLDKIGSHVSTVQKLKPFIKGYYKWRS